MDGTDDALHRHADRIEGYGRSLVAAAARLRDTGGRDPAPELPPTAPDEAACFDAFRAELDNAERLADETARLEARQLASINFSICLMNVPPPEPVFVENTDTTRITDVSPRELQQGSSTLTEQLQVTGEGLETVLGLALVVGGGAGQFLNVISDGLTATVTITGSPQPPVGGEQKFTTRPMDVVLTLADGRRVTASESGIECTFTEVEWHINGIPV